MTRPATLTFLGAAGTVTGSRFLVDAGDARVLVECGLFQGLKQERLRNWDTFPVEPASIDAVVVTHAHVDHVGFLPRLCRSGFAGPVVCSSGTAALARIVLPDSGHLQEEEAAWANRGGYSKHRPALPLYTEVDAEASLERLTPQAFDVPVPLAPGVTATLRPAGHILGSATVRLDVDLGPSVLFSGDLGRHDHPLLRPPAPPGDVDVVVMESTYGGRARQDDDSVDRLASLIERTASRGGTVVVPAFAVDRTEVVLYHLRRLMDDGRVPRLPVHVDSPMALRALDVYRRAIAAGDPDIDPRLRHEQEPFDTGHLHEVRSVAASKALADTAMPSIIVSASGMATGGRVLHHLSRLLPDPRNAVALVGFQAAGTRGRLLQEGRTELKMLGRYVPVRAEVVSFDGFSVHADHDELLSWLGAATPAPELTYLVHGEPAASAALQAAVVDRLGWRAVVPSPGERVSLGP